LEFTRIQKALVEANQVSKQTIAELLEMEIEGQLQLQGQQQGQIRRGFQQMGVDRSFRQGQRVDFSSQRDPMSGGQRLKRDIY